MINFWFPQKEQVELLDIDEITKLILSKKVKYIYTRNNCLLLIYGNKIDRKKYYNINFELIDLVSKLMFDIKGIESICNASSKSFNIYYIDNSYAEYDARNLDNIIFRYQDFLYKKNE